MGYENLPNPTEADKRDSRSRSGALFTDLVEKCPAIDEVWIATERNGAEWMGRCFGPFCGAMLSVDTLELK